MPSPLKHPCPGFFRPMPRRRPGSRPYGSKDWGFPPRTSSPPPRAPVHTIPKTLDPTRRQAPTPHVYVVVPPPVVSSSGPAQEFDLPPPPPPPQQLTRLPAQVNSGYAVLPSLSNVPPRSRPPVTTRHDFPRVLISGENKVKAWDPALSFHAPS